MLGAIAGDIIGSVHLSLGGDADTLACIAGAVAEAHDGGVPRWIAVEALSRLDDRLRNVVLLFQERYEIPRT